MTSALSLHGGTDTGLLQKLVEPQAPPAPVQTPAGKAKAAASQTSKVGESTQDPDGDGDSRTKTPGSVEQPDGYYRASVLTGKGIGGRVDTGA